MSLLDLLGVNRIFKAGKPVDPTRKILNFIGDVTIVDNPGSLRTDITIGAGGGGGGGEGTVVGPDTSTAGNVTTWNSADGTTLADSGLALADVATEAYVDAAVSAVPGTPLVPAGQSSGVGVTSTTGTTGAATTAARSDHTHGHGDLLGGTLHAVASASMPGFVSAADKAKLDGIATGATSTPLVTANQSSPGGVASAASGNTGTAGTGARSDHTHGHGDLLGGTLHAVATTSTPGFCSAADKTKLDGIATGATATPLILANQLLTGGVVSANGNTGTNPNAARADHVHVHGDLIGGTLHAVATTAAAGFMSGADKTKIDGVAAGATSTPLVAASQAVTGGVTSTTGTTGAATTAARSDHSHGHGDLAGGTLHAVATPTVAGFMSSVDKTRTDALYASSQALKRSSRLVSLDGWPGDPSAPAWNMWMSCPNNILNDGSDTGGLAWIIDITHELPPNAVKLKSLDLRLVGPSPGEPSDPPSATIGLPYWMLTSVDRNGEGALEIAQQYDTSTTWNGYTQPHSIAWSGDFALSPAKRYMLEVSPESGVPAQTGTVIVSLNVECEFAATTASSVTDRFMALLAAKGIFAFEARNNTNDGTNVLTFVDLIDPARVVTLAGTGKIAKPVALAGYGGAITAFIPGALNAMCNRPPSAFRALHDGTGMELRQIANPTIQKTQVTLTTRVSTAGVTFLFSSANGWHSYVTNAGVYPASALVDTGPVTCPATGTPLSTHFRYSASTQPNWRSHVAGGGTDKTGQQTASPYAGDSEQTLELFSDGTNHFTGNWFGTYAFQSLTDAERALVDEYQVAMTGIVP